MYQFQLTEITLVYCVFCFFSQALLPEDYKQQLADEMVSSTICLYFVLIFRRMYAIPSSKWSCFLLVSQTRLEKALKECKPPPDRHVEVLSKVVFHRCRNHFYRVGKFGEY